MVPFIEDMASAYGWADLVLCRAGALTVSELAVMVAPPSWCPAHAIDDHQSANARSLSDHGGAMLLRQSEMSVEALTASLLGYMVHPSCW